MIWPFKKVSPFVKHIISSLETDPDSWAIREYSTRHRGGNKTDWDWRTKSYLRAWISSPGLRLSYSGGDVVLIDTDARTYFDWIIEKPRNVVMSKHDSTKLSVAVKAWREQALLKQLATDANDTRLLDEAMKELEDEIG